MKYPGPKNTLPNPSLKPQSGPNWKLIRNLCIIAGLLYAISFTWNKLHEIKATRERERHEAEVRKAEAREKAIEEARLQAEASRRASETPVSGTSTRPVPNPQPQPPVEVTPRQTDHSASNGTTEPEKHTPEPELPPEIVALNTKARELVTAADAKRNEQLAENARNLAWNLDAYIRTLSKTDQNMWLPHVTRIKNSVTNNRVPSSIPTSSGVDMSPGMAKIARYSAEKQEQIDRDFLAETGKIHSAYLRKIRDAITEAGNNGRKPLADALNRTLDDASDLLHWLRGFDIDPAPRGFTP